MTISHLNIQTAIALFNARQFFECHEVLEDLWRPLPPCAEKSFLQGLIQVAVGLHHLQRQNFVGARNKLQSGLEKLEAVQQELAHNNAIFTPPFPLATLIINTRTALSELLRLGPERIAKFPEVMWPRIPFI